jgi:murein hydrolase activator
VTHSPTRSACILLAAACLLGAPLQALAQSATSPDEARSRLEADKGRLDASEKRTKDLQGGLDKLSAERERINARLVETGKLIQLHEAQLGSIESKLGELDIQEQQLRSTLAQRHGAISALLAALQRMGRNPPPVMITRREDALTMVRSAMLLSSAFPEMRVQAEGLAKELADLSQVIRGGRAEREKLTAEKTRHDEARVRLAALQDEKRRSTTQQQAELNSVRQEVARIAKNVEEMTDFLKRLDKEVGGRLPAPAAGKEGGAEPGDLKAAAVMAPSGERVAMATPGSIGRIKPNLPFDLTKGTLQLPTQGKRLLSFGQKTPFGTQSKGIGLQARYGGTVISPCDGTIIYAGEFRTYGQLLIISPGGGYHVLLAGLSQIDVQVGQSVLMGEPVGVMSSAVKTQAAQDSGPVLTVEFRKDQRPIDPDPWWSDGSRKVQG